jgi:AraC-like DNA-binding protein
LILPDQIHSYHTPQNSRVWIGVFSEDYIYDFSSQIQKKTGKQAKFSCDNTVRDFILQILIEKDIRDIYLQKSCFYAICDQYQKSGNLISKEFNDDNLLCKIVDYVSNHFQSNITLRQMARDLGFEYHYCSRRFHSIFNMNFCQFVNQYRVNYANELLKQNYRSISDVAFDSGFQSVRSFNNNYLTFFGTVPSQHK